LAVYTVGSDGTSLVWQGTLTFSNASDPFQTGVATLTATPSGGISNLPAIVDGTPGLPPVINAITVTQVPYGTTVPPSAFTLVDPGGPGDASVYDFTFYVQSGQQGTAGTNATISTASDLELPTGVTLGSATAGFTIYYDATHSKWLVSQPQMATGPYITLNSSFAAAYSGNAGAYQVATVGLPSLPWTYYPIVSAGLYVSGTVNTHVDLVARLNNATTGNQIGYGLGQTGAGPYAVLLGSAFGAGLTGGSTYGQVAANTTATVYLVADQINSTTDNWQTINTNGYLTVTTVPV